MRPNSPATYLIAPGGDPREFEPERIIRAFERRSSCENPLPVSTLTMNPIEFVLQFTIDRSFPPFAWIFSILQTANK